ncbi:MAG: universal stress protein [Deltaproteobacteria bacterium]|nr:universal stress protein [Deltaproteobacteria bacterium]
MFDRILLATTASPTSDAAANLAFELAAKYDSQLFVLHVLGIPARGFGIHYIDVRTGEEEHVDQNYLDLVQEEMRQTYEKQLATHNKVQMVALTGIPHTEILRKARKEDADLIIMGAHTREEDVGATRFRGVVGNTMQKVARSARCPVLITSRPCATCWWYFSNIVVGTDFSKASEAAFMFGLKLSREIPCKLHVFNAVDVSAGMPLSQTEVEKKISDARDKMVKLHGARLNDDDNYEMDVWEGIPYVEILKYAREKSADLIIMAHHTREVDPEKASLGSTVEQVVLRASCPVASVNRPDKVTL